MALEGGREEGWGREWEGDWQSLHPMLPAAETEGQSHLLPPPPLPVEINAPSTCTCTSLRQNILCTVSVVVSGVGKHALVCGTAKGDLFIGGVLISGDYRGSALVVIMSYYSTVHVCVHVYPPSSPPSLP